MLNNLLRGGGDDPRSTRGVPPRREYTAGNLTTPLMPTGAGSTTSSLRYLQHLGSPDIGARSYAREMQRTPLGDGMSPRLVFGGYTATTVPGLAGAGRTTRPSTAYGTLLRRLCALLAPVFWVRFWVSSGHITHSS